MWSVKIPIKFGIANYQSLGSLVGTSAINYYHIKFGSLVNAPRTWFSQIEAARNAQV